MEYVPKRGGKYAYLRKAADLGSREAQYTVAEILSDIEDESETEEAFKYRMSIAKDLYSCASEQGLGDASNELALGLLFHKKYSEALVALHRGTKKWS